MPHNPLPHFKTIGAVASFFIDSLPILRAEQTEDTIYFYRGHYYNKYVDNAPIYRNVNRLREEDINIRELIRKCPTDFSNCTTTFERLVKMQHYSLPTRLLDITSNPLVALFFACWKSAGESNDNVNGELIVYAVNRKDIRYFDDKEVCLLSNIAMFPYETKMQKGHRDFKHIISRIKQENPYFYINDAAFNQVLCVMPKLDNPRIIRQSGAFFLFGCNGTKAKPAELIVPKYKININKDKKERILRDLDSLGINESTLFPEIENVAHFLRQHP